MTPAQAREHLSDAWASAMLVVDHLREHHPVQSVACRLSVRMLTSALLAIDRVVAELERAA